MVTGTKFKLLEKLIDVIPNGSCISLIGLPGSGKTVFCENLLGESLKQEISSLYIITQSPPDTVRKYLQFTVPNIDMLEQNKKFAIVDAYSWLLNKKVEKYAVDDLSDLSHFNATVSKATNELGENKFVIFDSPSTLTQYNSEEVVIKFLRSFFAKERALNDICICPLEWGVHSDSFYNIVNSNADGIFGIKIEQIEDKLERLFRVFSFRTVAHNTKWVNFKIVNPRKVIMEKYISTAIELRLSEAREKLNDIEKVIHMHKLLE